MAIDDNTSYELMGAQVKDLAQKIRAKADSASLASVATSGLYADIIGAPTIPTVYNGTLTITQGGNTLGTFTANSSTNETIDIPAGGSGYTAGTGIDITNDVISIDNTVVAELSDLPTVNDGTLTIQHNGTTKGTFTANQSTASTVNIETIYADTPGTATTPAASVQASDIVWSTMPFNYSTTEVDTGCTWIDGSHIYRKTVDVSSFPNATSKAVAHSISNLNNVVRVEGFAKDSSGVRITLPFASAANIADQIAIRVETSNIVIITGINRSGFSGYVTLWYTKTS